MKTKNALLLLLGVVLASVSRADTVEIREILVHPTSNSEGRAYADANWQIRLFLIENLPGRNIKCYLAPTPQGYVQIWIGIKENLNVPIEVRDAVDAIVEKYLFGGKKSETTSAAKVVPMSAVR